MSVTVIRPSRAMRIKADMNLEKIRREEKLKRDFATHQILNDEDVLGQIESFCGRNGFDVKKTFKPSDDFLSVSIVKNGQQVSSFSVSKNILRGKDPAVVLNYIQNELLDRFRAAVKEPAMKGE